MKYSAGQKNDIILSCNKAIESLFSIASDVYINRFSHDISIINKNEADPYYPHSEYPLLKQRRFYSLESLMLKLLNEENHHPISFICFELYYSFFDKTIVSIFHYREPYVKDIDYISKVPTMGNNIKFDINLRLSNLDEICHILSSWNPLALKSEEAEAYYSSFVPKLFYMLRNNDLSVNEYLSYITKAPSKTINRYVKLLKNATLHSSI